MTHWWNSNILKWGKATAIVCAVCFSSARAEFSNGFNSAFFGRNFSPLSLSSGGFNRSGFQNFSALNGLTGANNLGQIVGAGLFNQNGNLDLSAAIPQTAANFSRVLQVNNLNVGNQNELNLRAFIADPRSGFAVQQVRLEPFTGLLQSRPSDPFGNRFNNFNFGGIDNEAAKQAEKFFLENLANKTVNNLEKRLRGFNNNEVLELLGAVNLSRQALGPDLSRGVLRVQCQDVLMTAVNDTEIGSKVDADYAKLTPEDRCVATVSAALNHLKPFGKPPVRVDKSMLRNGILTVPNLLQTYSLPALAVFLKRADNTNICNYERGSPNPVWSMEDLVMQAMNPTVYNAVKGFDTEDLNRNLFLQTGVNLALPRQFMGAVGAQAGLFASNLTDLAFIDNRQSGVGRSGLTRELRAWANSVGRVFFTFDTNAEKSGAQLGSQNIRQTGRNNLGFGQGEGWRQDVWGGIDWLLTAAPNADGKIAGVAEVPASAAHAGAIPVGGTSAVIVNGQCIQCHRDASAILDSRRGGPYTPLNVQNANSVANLSSNFSNARVAYQNFKRLTNQFIPDSEHPGATKEILWDVYQKVKQPKSINYAANQLGLSGNQLRSMMVQDPSLPVKLQLDEKGNIDTPNWLAGGKCSVKFALQGRRAGGVSNGALRSTAGPQGIVESKKPKSDAEPHT